MISSLCSTGFNEHTSLPDTLDVATLPCIVSIITTTISFGAMASRHLYACVHSFKRNMYLSQRSPTADEPAQAAQCSNRIFNHHTGKQCITTSPDRWWWWGVSPFPGNGLSGEPRPAAQERTPTVAPANPGPGRGAAGPRWARASRREGCGSAPTAGAAG